MSETTHDAFEHQVRLSSTFLELIDTLVEDFDVIDLLTVLSTRSVELLGAAEAGILLADASGQLRVMAASTEQINLLELFQVQNDEGPCMESYATGKIVAATDMRVSAAWPSFAAECVAAGFPSVCAVPMRLRSQIIGCLNLFMATPGALTPSDVALAQALADVASIAIIQNRAARDAAERQKQLQHALDSRILIEQAKGMLAERNQTDMTAAFDTMRAFARNNNLRLTDVAESIVAGTTPLRLISNRSRGADEPRPGAGDPAIG